MNRLYYLGLAFLATILLMSCSDDDNSTNPDDNNTETFSFPLERGNEWVYEEVFYDNDGNEGDRSGNERSITVGETVTLFGKDGYMITTTDIIANGTAIPMKKYACASEEGYYEYDPTFFDMLEEADPNVERKWIKLFGLGQETWTAYSYYNAAPTVQDSHIVNEANIRVKYEGTKELTSSDSTTITVKVYTITTYYHIDTPENTYTESSTRTYYVHEEYGILSDREVQTGGNGGWGWKQKSKNY